MEEKKKRNFAYADFETTTIAISETESNMYCWGIVDGKTSEFKYGIDMTSFFDLIIKEGYSDIKFHNLSWDGNYIFKWMLNNDFVFCEDKDELYESVVNAFSWLCDESGSIYQINAYYKNRRFKISCTYKQLMSSAAKIGKSLGMGIEKLDIDYDAYDVFESIEDLEKETELLKYLERDVRIVEYAHKEFTSILDEKMTLSSMALENFKQFYGLREFVYDFGGKLWSWRQKQLITHNVLSIDDWKFVNRSYQGGYVGWKKGIEDKVIKVKNGVSADANSMFPSHMQIEKLPYGPMLTSKPKGDYATLIEVHIFKAKIKNKKHPPLFKERTGRYGLPKYLDVVENDDRVFWEEEWNFILKYYNVDYVIVSKKYFKIKHSYKEWINITSSYKTNATNAFHRNLYKGVLNCPYGKNGQNPVSYSRIIIKDGKIPWQEKHIDKKTKKKYFYYNDKKYYVDDPKSPIMRRKGQASYGKNDEYVHSKTHRISDVLSYVPIASYTTMKARLDLLKIIYDNFDIWLYSDTDSCYFTDTPKNINLHATAFGAWKWEYKFDKFKVIRAKCYMFNCTGIYDKKLNENGEWDNGIMEWRDTNKLIKKISGVSDVGKDKITWKNFYNGSVIKGGKRGKINVKNGLLIVDRDYQIGKGV